VLKRGTTGALFAPDAPPQLVGVLRGLIILFVAMPEFFRLMARGLPGTGSKSKAVATDGGTAGDRGGETDE
jgi:simple sugar transport system permease protein